jgi:ribonuclease P protein component
MKIEKLRKNSEFRAVYRRGKSFSNSILVLYVFKNYKNKDFNRLGISVSKKVGSSVVRSRTKRLIRESYRLNKYKLRTGYDFIFIARSTFKGSAYIEVEKAVMDLMNKFKMVK